MDEAPVVSSVKFTEKPRSTCGCGGCRALPATDRPRSVRLWSAVIFLPSAFLIGVGRWLTPDAAGVGTHRQLGMAPCAFLHVTGIPCPMCGCTTAVSFVAHGQWLKAIVTQPFGAAVGFAALAGLVLSVIGIASGRWYGPSWFRIGWWWTLHRVWIILGFAAFLLMAWAWKVYAYTHGM